jgi:hypothetical protein
LVRRFAVAAFSIGAVAGWVRLLSVVEGMASLAKQRRLACWQFQRHAGSRFNSGCWPIRFRYCWALVFIWIIFTYYAQREELGLQRAEMAAQRKEFEKLAVEAHSQSGLQQQTAAALTKANELQMTMERPYVMGGGSYWRHPIEYGNSYVLNANGERRFRVDVSNYGKTPAYLFAFDVQFEKKAQVKASLLRVFPNQLHHDLLPPGGAHRNGIDGHREFWIPTWAEVVFGAFWYRDIWGKAHMFRFILSLSDPETLSDVDCLGGYRGHWGLDKDLNIIAA